MPRQAHYRENLALMGDDSAPMLRRMVDKRLRGYGKIGYSVE